MYQYSPMGVKFIEWHSLKRNQTIIRQEDDKITFKVSEMWAFGSNYTKIVGRIEDVVRV